MIPVGHAPFNGIYPATICPFDAFDAIDEAALVRHVVAMAEVPGCVGVLCNGHAGENFTLSRDEKRRVVEIVHEAIGDRMIVVSGINCENSLEAVHHARDAAVAGADALMIFPANSWALSQDASMAITHHRMVIEATDIPIMLFQASVNSGQMAYTPEVLSQLAQLPRVVAVKEGSWETSAYEANRRLIKDVAPHVAVMASGDEHLLASYVLGSEGSFVSLACIVPETIVTLDRAVCGSDLAAARRAHEVIYPLAKAIYGRPPGWRATARLKTCLKLLGRLGDDRVRPPMGALDAGEVNALSQALVTAGLL
ncbi:MAG: dihydrodipicolinate synthetase [Candidatus Entotheonella factor]|uniref:Dihydrodipicolinate synthetase n=1 Tax=Entotheonella factor TaxID=1429438 RepID=W4L8Z5_ENTF1|nr:dihydrodipicolinate synthase family protein [Candidatus Entotheonella palauensis]ETW93786.1 MAG: dihydrodipicolinate synthetase [Candidatus Entotheonella factor]